jgi:hypothetical protein
MAQIPCLDRFIVESDLWLVRKWASGSTQAKPTGVIPAGIDVRATFYP